MDIKQRFEHHIPCYLNPEYFNKINNLINTVFSHSRVREVVPEHGKSSMTKCIF